MRIPTTYPPTGNNRTTIPSNAIPQRRGRSTDVNSTSPLSKLIRISPIKRLISFCGKKSKDGDGPTRSLNSTARYLPPDRREGDKDTKSKNVLGDHGSSEEQLPAALLQHWEDLEMEVARSKELRKSLKQIYESEEQESNVIERARRSYLK